MARHAHQPQLRSQRKSDWFSDFKLECADGNSRWPKIAAQPPFRAGFPLPNTPGVRTAFDPASSGVTFVTRPGGCLAGSPRRGAVVAIATATQEGRMVNPAAA